MIKRYITFRGYVHYFARVLRLIKKTGVIEYKIIADENGFAYSGDTGVCFDSKVISAKDFIKERLEELEETKRRLGKILESKEVEFELD